MRPKKKLRYTSCFLTFVVFFLFALPAYADVRIQENFSGLLVVTSPAGDVIILEQGDPLPVIAQGASLEIYDGRFEVTTGAGEKVSLFCLNHDITVADGASAALTCHEESGSLEVLKGTVHMVDDQGVESDLPEGTVYPIKAGEPELAPPTGAGDMGGFPATEPVGDVDSRNIEEEVEPPPPASPGT